MKKTLREKIDQRILNRHQKPKLAQFEGITNIITLLAFIRQRKREKIKAERHEQAVLLERRLRKFEVVEL